MLAAYTWISVIYTNHVTWQSPIDFLSIQWGVFWSNAFDRWLPSLDCWYSIRFQLHFAKMSWLLDLVHSWPRLRVVFAKMSWLPDLVHSSSSLRVVYRLLALAVPYHLKFNIQQIADHKSRIHCRGWASDIYISSARAKIYEWTHIMFEIDMQCCPDFCK